MALQIGSTLLGVGQDNIRISNSFVKQAAETYYGGLVVTQLPASDLTGKQIQLFDGLVSATQPLPLGLVIEPGTYPFPVNSSQPDQFAGNGFDNLDYARGGLYSIFSGPGSFCDIFNDHRDTEMVDRTDSDATGSLSQEKSCPFIYLNSTAYVPGTVLYATADGLLTPTVPTASGDHPRIAVVRAVEGSVDANMKIAIELLNPTSVLTVA